VADQPEHAHTTARGAQDRAQKEDQGLKHGEETKYTVDSAGPQIEEFLDTVFDHLDFDVEYEILEGQHLHPELEDPDLLVKFTGPDVDLLLANKAELMLAVEFLTMEVLRMPPEHHSRLCYDANDYRMLRIEELRLSAMTAAEKVKQTRRPFHFNPMNSRERRIIHLSLRNETEIRSESTGTGPFRQVVVLPLDMPLPEPIRPPLPPPPRRDGPPGRRPGGPPRRGGDRDRDRRPRR
jgi:spoIIIJ-associated protein